MRLSKLKAKKKIRNNPILTLKTKKFHLTPKRRRGLYLKLSALSFIRKYYFAIKSSIILLIVLLLVYISHYVFFVSGYFFVKNITTSGTDVYVNKNDLETLINFKIYGKPIIFMNPSTIEDLVQKNFLGVKSVNVKKSYPDKIDVSITEREPITVIYNQTDNQKYLIDLEGYVLGLAGESFDKLPVIDFSGDIRVGMFLNEKIIPLSKEILDSADKNDLKLSKIEYSEKFVTIITDRNTEILISNANDIGNSIKVAVSVIKKLSLEGKNLKKIDLRYDKVIVSYD